MEWQKKVVGIDFNRRKKSGIDQIKIHLKNSIDKWKSFQGMYFPTKQKKKKGVYFFYLVKDLWGHLCQGFGIRTRTGPGHELRYFPQIGEQFGNMGCFLVFGQVGSH